LTGKKDTSFKIIVLGSGSCVPSYKRFPASYFFSPFGSKENWLVDIGEGALFRLSEAGESYKEIDRIFISHTHPDHIGALIPLLLALNYTPGFKRKKPLYVYGSDDIRKYLQINLDFAPYLVSGFPLDFISLSPDIEIKFKNCSLNTKKMKHFDPTLGFRWNFNGCAVVYGADGGLSDELIRLSESADLLILESSYRKDNPTAGHLTTYQAGEIAKKAKAKRLMLTHFYPEVADMKEKEILAEVKSSGYEGKILLAKDLMTLEI
jgi:ribonuclease BN (tRNA processing enzyme)